MTSERATCETCRWWEDLRGMTPFLDGRCHIRSVPQDDMPQRAARNWCGEHQPREVRDE